MAEAGPEAIMPLKRGANGKLGVQATGGIGNIVVNVDATGSSIQGNNKDANQFGQEIASAVQAVIINEKRVGGLLS